MPNEANTLVLRLYKWIKDKFYHSDKFNVTTTAPGIKPESSRVQGECHNAQLVIIWVQRGLGMLVSKYGPKNVRVWKSCSDVQKMHWHVREKDCALCWSDWGFICAFIMKKWTNICAFITRELYMCRYLLCWYLLCWYLLCWYLLYLLCAFDALFCEFLSKEFGFQSFQEVLKIYSSMNWGWNLISQLYYTFIIYVHRACKM